MKHLYFLPGGKLSFTAPAAATNTFDEFVSDPNKPVRCDKTLDLFEPRP
jgi:hypothetical protein